MTTQNTQPQVFNFDTDTQIRTVSLEGKPWFVGKDVAEALGYKRTADAIRQHCKKAVAVGVGDLQTLDPQTKIIPEADVYRLIMKSTLPKAEEFEEWVMEEVLPTIRKTGGTYMSDNALEQTLQDPDYMIGVLTQLKAIQQERDTARLERNEAIRTKAQINNKKTATAMATASKEARRAKKLENELGRLKNEYISMKRMRVVHKGISFSWQKLKTETEMQDHEIRFETYQSGGHTVEVKAYHRDVWLEAYGISIDSKERI